MILAVGTAFYYYSLSSKPASLITQHRSQEKALNEAIGKLYLDESMVFPNNAMDPNDLQRIEASVEDYSQKVQDKSNKIQVSFDLYQKKLEVQEVVNNLFERPVITNQGFQEGISLKEELDPHQVHNIYKNYYFYRKRDAYEIGVNQYLDQAKNYADLIIQAQNELEDLQYLPKTGDHLDVLVNAIRDIFEVQSILPQGDFKNIYDSEVQKALKSFANQMENWQEDEKETLLDQLPKLKDYVKIEGDE